MTGDFIFLGSDLRLLDVKFIQERFFVIMAVLSNPDTKVESNITYFYYFKTRQSSGASQPHLL